MLQEIRETDAELSGCSEQQTASHTGDNFYQKSSQVFRMRTQAQCPNCLHREQELVKLNNMVSQMKRVEQLLLNQLRDLKEQLGGYRKSIDDMNLEVKLCHEKIQSLTTDNSLLGKQNIEFKRKGLSLESELVQLKQESEELSEIKSTYQTQQKFVDSLLHMVQSCHPQGSFPQKPSLKQAWKWLKTILSDYMQLKQLSKSGQSSSSTNK